MEHSEFQEELVPNRMEPLCQNKVVHLFGAGLFEMIGRRDCGNDRIEQQKSQVF